MRLIVIHNIGHNYELLLFTIVTFLSFIIVTFLLFIIVTFSVVHNCDPLSFIILVMLAPMLFTIVTLLSFTIVTFFGIYNCDLYVICTILVPLILVSFIM